MAIFGRKKESNENEIPNLPELPNLTDDSRNLGQDDLEKNDYSIDMPNIDNEIKALPSFPDSDFGDSLSQEAVKSAIEPIKINKNSAMEFKETKFVLPKTIQKSAQKPVSLNFPATLNKPIYQETINPIYSPLPKIEPMHHAGIENNYLDSQNQPSIQEKKSNEPVYIRIDKFKFALDSFQYVKEKINEVEKYLSEIKEQKRREDEELKEWENEIEAIKLRIEGIDNKIFSKV